MLVRDFLLYARKAESRNNVYVLGGFGVVLKGKQLDRYTSNYEYNRDHAEKIRKAAENQPCFGFDCVGLIKGLLWGWNGNGAATYGGAKYNSNDVPDAGADSFFKHYCHNMGKPTDWMTRGCILHKEGHVAIYLGEGIALESTRNGNGKIRRCNVKGVGNDPELPTVAFEDWGLCNFIDYGVSKTYLVKSDTGTMYEVREEDLPDIIKNADSYPLMIYKY